MTEHDVIVVGAGMAGLACARALTDAGRSPLVLERSHTVGGRVRTDAVDGFLLDHGFQVLPLAYPEARAALDFERLDLGLFERGAIIRSDGRFRRLADPRHDPVRSLRALAGGLVGVRDGAAVLRLLHDGGDETTTADALRRAGVSRTTVETFFAPFLRGVFLEPRLTTSSRFLHFVLQAFSNGPAALPGEGMGAIAKQLAERLDIRKGTAVATVGPHAVSLESGEQLRGGAVVVATAGLVDEPGHGWNGVTCVYYDAPASPIPGPWLVVNGEGGPINNLWVPSEVAARYAPAERALVSATILGAGEPDLHAVYGPAGQLVRQGRGRVASSPHLPDPEGAALLPGWRLCRAAGAPCCRPLCLRRSSRAPVAEWGARVRPPGRGGSARGLTGASS